VDERGRGSHVFLHSACISREKEVKAWTRAKRVALIERQNRIWDDLAQDWYEGDGALSMRSRSLAALSATNWTNTFAGVRNVLVTPVESRSLAALGMTKNEERGGGEE
jgi:hypothetical protein